MNRSERRKAAAGKPKPKKVILHVAPEDVAPHLHRHIPWTPFEPSTLPKPTMDDIRAMIAHTGAPEEAVREQFERVQRDEIWVNSRYQVNIDRNVDPGDGWPKMIHLSIKRLDKEPIHDWRDLQRIKNELVGAEHEAVELYPAESRVVDSANQYHLWAIAEKGVKFPFGWMTGFKQPQSHGNAKQRPFES